MPLLPFHAKRPLNAFMCFAMIASLLSACGSTGDFGRPRQTALREWVTPVHGRSAVSLPYTENEEEMRARAWRFLKPSQQRHVFDHILSELSRTGYIEEEWVEDEPEIYYQALMRIGPLDRYLGTGRDFRSPSSRYNRIADDAMADRQLIRPFAHAAGRVMEADGLRLKAIASLTSPSPEEREEARTRIGENKTLAEWVCRRANGRVRAYRHAMERLVVAAPQREAVTAERQVLALEEDMKALKPWGCRLGPDKTVMLPERGLRMPPDGLFRDDEPNAIERFDGPIAKEPRKLHVK
jgi:hypothetical protein